MLSLSENDKLSAEDKMERRKELQEQLEDFNKMILERNMEIKKEEREEKSKAINEQLEKQLSKDENSNNVDFDDYMQNYISMGNSLNAVKTQNSIRIKLKGETRILKSEIKLDQARGVDTTKKREKLSTLSTKIDKITSGTSESLNKVDEEVKKGVVPVDKHENKVSGVKNDADKEDKTVENKAHKFIDVHI